MNKLKIRIFYRNLDKLEFLNAYKGPWFWHINIINAKKSLMQMAKYYNEKHKLLII